MTVLLMSNWVDLLWSDGRPIMGAHGPRWRSDRLIVLLDTAPNLLSVSGNWQSASQQYLFSCIRLCLKLVYAEMGMWTGDLSPDERLAQFPAYSLTADLSVLPAGDKAALSHLLKAGKALDELYLSQWWQGNVDLRKKLADSGESKILEVFDMYKGPFGISSMCEYH
jgi:hypothetical protein